MIQCPYCQSNLDESAKFCGRCLSLLVAQHEHRGQEWPSWLHPYAVLAVIAIFSAGLLAFSLIGRPERKTADNSKTTAENKTEQPSDTSPAAQPTPTDTEPAPAAPDAAAPAPGDVSLDEMDAYDRDVQAILAESDRITADLDRLLAQNSDSNLNALGDLTRQLQFQSQKMRKLTAPRVIAQIHNKLSNAQSILYRGYQKLMHYQKSGDVAKLDEGRRDVETAKEKRQAALDEIAAVKKNLPAPAASPPAAETPPPAETPPAAETPPPATEEPPANVNPWPPARNRQPGANEGKDGAGDCIPKRLVEMYPPGPTRDKIISSFAGQYHATRVCGEPLVVPQPPDEEEAPAPGDGNNNQPEGPGDEAGVPPDNTAPAPPVYEDTPTEEVNPHDEPAQP